MCENLCIRLFGTSECEQAVVGYLDGSRIGGQVDLSAEADIAHNMAMEIAAVNRKFVDETSVPTEFVEKEKDILIARAEDSGKPPEIIEKMIQGRLKKFLAEVTLLEQPYVKDEDQTVGELLSKAGASISSFVRYEVGEGIEKKVEDFATERGSQLSS